MGARLGGSGLLIVVLCASPATWAQGPTIDHKGVGCVMADRFPSLEAKIAPEHSVARARLYFRASGTAFWYFVEMKAEAGSYWAVLPKPKKTVERLDYYVEAVDKALATSRTAEHSPVVVSGSGQCSGDLPAAAALSTAAVKVGLAGSGVGAPILPAGFASAGTTTVSVTGPGAAAEAAAGVSTKAIVLGAAGATAIGGGVAIAAGQGGGESAGARQTRVLSLYITNACDWIGAQPPVSAGDQVTFIVGVGQWPTPAEAAAALTGTTASIVLDGNALPLRYEGITQHQVPGGSLGGYGNQAFYDAWVATAGTHSVYGAWSLPTSSRATTCAFTVQQ